MTKTSTALCAALAMVVLAVLAPQPAQAGILPCFFNCRPAADLCGQFCRAQLSQESLKTACDSTCRDAPEQAADGDGKPRPDDSHDELVSDVVAPTGPPGELNGPCTRFVGDGCTCIDPKDCFEGKIPGRGCKGKWYGCKRQPADPIVQRQPLTEGVAWWTGCDKRPVTLDRGPMLACAFMHGAHLPNAVERYAAGGDTKSPCLDACQTYFKFGTTGQRQCDDGCNDFTDDSYFESINCVHKHPSGAAQFGCAFRMGLKGRVMQMKNSDFTFRDRAIDNSPFDVHMDKAHPAEILGGLQGTLALLRRLEMADRARKSIEVEYFIFNKDKSSRLITQALVRAAKERNVKVRVLLDGSKMVQAVDDSWMQAMRDNNVEVKLYNPVATIRVVSSNYRNHRKLFCVDGVECIVGGRNIGDDYFDLGEHYNFNDRDIYVKGPICREISNSFSRFWAEDIAEVVGVGATVADSDRQLMTAQPQDEHLRREVERVGRRQEGANKMKGTCNVPHFVTDEPGFVFLGNGESDKRHTRDAILRYVDSVPSGQTYMLESPYFILKDRGNAAFDALVQRRVKATLLTNSLGSTDAYYVAAIFNLRVQQYAGKGDIKLYVRGSQALTGQDVLKDEQGEPYIKADARWGMHSKAQIYGDHTFTIGTFNIDPRSANINAELTLFCRDSPDLTKLMYDDVLSQVGQARMLGESGVPIDGEGKYKDADVSMTKYFLSALPAHFLDSLF